MGKAGHQTFELEAVRRVEMLDTRNHELYMRARVGDRVMEIQVPLSMVHQINKLRDVIANRFGVPLGRDAVEELAQRAETARRCYGTRRLGWTTDRQAFFYADKVFGAVGKLPSTFVASDGTQTAAARLALRPKGDRSEQYAVLRTVRRASDVFRLILSMVAVSPFLEIMGAPIIIFHLAGATGSGKTTLLRLGLSIYADPDSHLFTVNFAKDTENFVDSALGILHNLPFVLDETTTKTPTQLINAAYRISTGMTKGRLRGADHDFSPVDSQAYTLTCLMSGERSIVKRMNALGARARLLEIVVHDHLVSPAEGKRLYDFARRCHGWFGRDLFASAFRTYFRDSRGGERLRLEYERLRSEMQKRWPEDHGRLIDALAAVRLGDYLVARQLAGFSTTRKPELARLRRRAKNFARRMYYRLQRTADPQEVIKQMRAIPKIERWVERGYVPIKTLQKHEIGRASGLTKNRLFGFLKRNGVVDKSEPRKIGKRTRRCYILTDRGRQLLSRHKKKRSAKAA